MSPTRRQVLKWGVGFGALASAGFAGRALLLPPAPSIELEPVGDLAVRLFEAIDDDGRAEACLGYEHPLRQYHNRGVDTGGRWGFQLNREARQILVDLVHASLSEAGRRRIPEQFFFQLPGVHAARVAICGDPRTPLYQILVTGPHLNLRIGGRSREGVAFGGPQIYGDQRGNGELGLPGSVYAYQLELGQRLFTSMTPGERSAARQPKAPVQTDIDLKGKNGVFSGVAVADLSRESRRLARETIAGILQTYAEDDVAYAWECIERNGGVDALRLADYDEDHQPGRRAGDGPSQIFRFEGPAAVFHYRGDPHLHAFFNIGMDGDHPLSVGDVIASNPAALEGAGVKSLFEAIMIAETGADLAYYPLEGVAGRLRAGPVRTGDLYNLESWRDIVTVVEVTGANLGQPIANALRARGDSVQAQSRYRIATVGYVADQLADEVLGTVESETAGPSLRDTAIAQLKARGFPTQG